MNASSVIAYTFQAEVLHPLCVIESMIASRNLSPAARGMATENVLDQHAEASAIDRMNESSFDSYEFPKVVFASQLDEGEHCGSCGEEI